MSQAVEGEIVPEEPTIEEQPETITESGAILKRIPECPEDPTPPQRMRLMETSKTLSFWNDPEEDVYSPEDGDPA